MVSIYINTDKRGLPSSIYNLYRTHNYETIYLATYRYLHPIVCHIVQHKERKRTRE